ncbi:MULTISPECIES: flagellar export protein FliJ [Alteromonadaceae]|uniref:flagellar export protein FliJ n=1 Tax=Alteromonadaceae TaxID=72275 RepID=UPI001C08FFEA|nr:MULTISPECIES: flagellar export protein FliJ [Aliiglaciecola]MBU2878023.1 flagellar export protein FliJ [Aliiglaciecola lipolytica]MDO6709388.1 flagellar export protein FliJ [Aliiglaciecola sp. 2_MG-2023]MDO6750536.1 flagellar export protein FliJ [Aliiglaciecola sp. 1_MG-2023]
MAQRQLELVARWEKDKEDRLAQDFQLAQQHAELNKQKLSSLEGYRLDYLRQTQMKGAGALNIDKFNKLHSFIGKLDRACQQQMQVHNQSVLVAEQRKNLWLAQQRKRKAVEMLLEKKRQAQEVRNNKLEQLFMDELSTQRFIRNQ